MSVTEPLLPYEHGGHKRSTVKQTLLALLVRLACAADALVPRG